MSSSALAAGLRQLRGKLAAQQRHDESDEQLLRAFTANRDDNAFAVLVRRHGPMVLHVCRRVLGHEQDAEDAFQATFLVLVRNADSLRNKASLASFLHGTAYRTALKAKQTAARRRKHEGSLGALTQPRSPSDPADELRWREVRTLLDEEIAQLSKIHRIVFVLFYLEDLNQQEIARRLGLKAATVAKRLTVARKRLGQSLRRRGVELTAVLSATALAIPSASAMPAGLMATTIKAASDVAGGGLTGVVSASVAELVQGATAATIANKAKIAAVVLLLVATSGSLVSWFGQASEPLATTTEPPVAKAGEKKPTPPQHTAAKGMEIHGRVLDPKGKPKAGAKILLLTHGANRKVTQLGVSAADGRFAVVIAQVAEDEVLPAIIAQADGAGIAFFGLYQWKPGKSEKPVELRLVKDRGIRGRIISTEGKPVVGAWVTVENLGVCANDSMDSVLASLKKRPYDWYWEQGVTRMAPPMSTRREGDALFAVTTDAEGRFVLNGLGDERFVTLRLSGGGIAEEELLIVNRDGFDAKSFNQAMLGSIPKKSGHPMIRTRWHGANVFLIAETEKVIRGIVKDADSGKGLPNVVVYLVHTELGLQTRTDAKGRYTLHGARKAKSYTLHVDEDATVGYMPCRVVAEDTIGYQSITADIKVKKGVIITGRMIDGATGKPLPGFVRAAVLLGNSFVKDFPGLNVTPARRIPTHSGANGVFRMVAIPGPILLMGEAVEEYKFKSVAPDPKYPQYFRKDANPGLTGYYNADGSIVPLLRNYHKVLQIKEDAKVVQQDIVLERASALPVRIQDAEGKPLAGAWIAGDKEWYPASQYDKAECAVYQLEAGKPRLLVFFHPARKLAGNLTLKGDEKTPATVKLGPAGSIKGRLLDAEGKPLEGVIVEVQYRQRPAAEVHSVVHRTKQIVSDAEGAFTLDDLIPGQKCQLSFRRGKRKFEGTPKPGDPEIKVKSGECRDLGAFRLKLLSEERGE